VAARTPFSVPAAIGFIALFGISVMDGIIVINQFSQLIERGTERTRAILDTWLPSCALSS
jgi:heavy metal efflux system protein